MATEDALPINDFLHRACKHERLGERKRGCKCNCASSGDKLGAAAPSNARRFAEKLQILIGKNLQLAIDSSKCSQAVHRSVNDQRDGEAIGEINSLGFSLDSNYSFTWHRENSSPAVQISRKVFLCLCFLYFGRVISIFFKSSSLCCITRRVKKVA